MLTNYALLKRQQRVVLVCVNVARGKSESALQSSIVRRTVQHC